MNILDNKTILTTVVKKSFFDKLAHSFENIVDKKVPTTSCFIAKKQKKEIKKILQPGDIVLETNNEYPVAQTLQKFTLGTDWTHMAMYMGKGKIAEANTNDGEQFSAHKKINKFLDTHHIAVVRPRYKTEADKSFVLQYMKGAEGRQYDMDYDSKDESKLYCSEAPYHAFRKMPNPINLPLTNVLGMYDIISPSSVLKSRSFDVVWSSNSNYWENQLSHYPLGVGTATGAGGLSYLGTKIGHPVALGVAGAVCGFAAAWAIMKLIWPSDHKIKQ